MPTYEYECGKCGHRLEAFQYFSEKPLRRCPACSRKTLRRLIGAGSAVIFKGSGFYETDYKRAGAGKRPGKASGDSGPGDAGSSGTTDSKSGADGSGGKKAKESAPAAKD
jgi:putative FmdB family regulatory protein